MPPRILLTGCWGCFLGCYAAGTWIWSLGSIFKVKVGCSCTFISLYNFMSCTETNLFYMTYITMWCTFYAMCLFLLQWTFLDKIDKVWFKFQLKWMLEWSTKSINKFNQTKVNANPYIIFIRIPCSGFTDKTWWLADANAKEYIKLHEASDRSGLPNSGFNLCYILSVLKIYNFVIIIEGIFFSKLED